MLLLNDLITFSEAFKTERPNLEASLVVAADDEVAKLIKDLSNADNSCTLITLIPSHDSQIKDEDNRKMQNNLTFMIVKKTDSKGGNSNRNTNFATTQIEILALLNKILSLNQSFNTNCLFNDIDLTNTPITPINDYFGQNGYMLDITTNTKL